MARVNFGGKTPHLLVAVSAGTLVLALAVGASPAISSPLHTAAGDCAPVEFVALPGTGETNPNANPDVPVGLLRTISDPQTQRFGNRVNVKFVPYSASAFNAGKTYAESLATGKAAVKKELTTDSSACPATRFVLAGYSQGAHGIGDVATDIGNGRGPVSADKILAVATIADPRRGTPGENDLGPRPTGVGIAGPRIEGAGALRNRWYTVCRTQPADLYCDISKNQGILSGLGSVLSRSTGADQSPASSLGSSMVTDMSGADLGGVD